MAKNKIIHERIAITPKNGYVFVNCGSGHEKFKNKD
jgi:hypothetical protein